jgi:hypothetical protein
MLIDIDQLNGYLKIACDETKQDEERKTAALQACELVKSTGIVNDDNMAKLKKWMPMLSMMAKKNKR